MINNFFGFKLAQEQTFNEKNKRLVVTKILTKPCEIVRIKNKDKNGYGAIVVKIQNKKKVLLKEIKTEDVEKFKIGDILKAAQVFKAGDKVSVMGKTKGKGFAGVVKRWGFAGGPKTHGQSDRERAPGSIGQRTTPGRVYRGKHMSGRMGGKTETIKNLKIFKLDEEKAEVFLQGLVPGPKGNLIEIKLLK